MELPHVGEQCSLKECRRLDYLPVKCTACKQIFCSEHFRFEAHHCPDEKSDGQQVMHHRQVNIKCPLCNRAVPLRATESPDHAVNEHITRNCFVETKEKVFSNQCSMTSCKRKELMPLTCERCRLNHCLSHRHPADHLCEGRKKVVEPPRAVPQHTHSIASINFGRSFQDDLSEEEALKVAIERSKQEAKKAQKKPSKSLTKSCKLN